MSLPSGTTLGPYEVLTPIGAGGMGEVYRARDTKLGRDVAVKVLPEGFARDAERMARFQREAKLLASLNHSNIASIYGIEDANGTRALVMELAEGSTLAERVARGPVPLEDALPIAKQIAEALEYAHEHGIIHRDLKPANVKVASDDTVKVLDFGLAKALETNSSAADVANSPTLSQMATQAGVLLGTAAYMSPEQAKGKSVDRRADIWAFGCVLYEMLTGTKAFSGETVTDTLGAIMRAEPDCSLLPKATPIRVRVLLQRCLQKDPKQRLRDIGDARISLEEVLSGAPEDAPALSAGARPSRQWQLWLVSGVAGLFVLATALLAFLYLHQKPPAREITRFQISLPEGATTQENIALSPDGRKLAFIATGADGQARLWVRSRENVDAQPLQGTVGANGWPFWSPDSRFIAFGTGGGLKKIDASGGPALTLCDAPSVFGGTWTRDDEIIFGSTLGLEEVPASGGSASPITTAGVAVGPSLLPDARHFLYSRLSGIYVGSLDAKPEQQSSKKLLADASAVAYTPSPNPGVGYLLFVRGPATLGGSGTLMAQRFDPRRLKLIGEAVPIAERVSNLGFSASATDALAYVPSAQNVVTAGARGYFQGRLTWFDRTGRVLGTIGDTGVYRTVALSPDGKRVAFERVDPQNPTNRNIWLYDFARGVTTRFTFGSAWESNPVWSPDGSHIAFVSNKTGQWQLYEKASNLVGNAELLFKAPDPRAKAPSNWSPDGRFLLFFYAVPPAQVWVLPLGGQAPDRKPVPFARSKFNEAAARFSPDGRWIAYSSDESGKTQIYVQPFDASALTGSPSARSASLTGKWMVSKDGGTTPLWRHDGKELFYLGADGNAMAVEVKTSGVFQAGVPKVLFKAPPGELYWDVSPDGKRFIMAAPSATSATVQPKLMLVLNWQSALKK